ncbi:hypothetical protein [Mycobacteroides abscessus]|uniref:hypothetical protein n=1 Tax=Mycobacteroides abscessus TaxID=36809 RepID=UPI002648F2C9|nr:hypothetical protein [Mycobacteroides abscessus]MDO3357796.1 hypothetical protein [Mycobacteroides abscessus subsp. massiliense]WKE45633.1 hypothetical protein P3M63_07465 [Mycobacteroides abscessus subsp. massiliense]
MTAPVITNDIEAVQEYAQLLDGDAAQWQEIAATATGLADTLESEAAAWEGEWQPEGNYSGAVALMTARLRSLATNAESTARALVERGEGAVKASTEQANTDEANGTMLDDIPVVGDIARTVKGLFT